MSWRARAVCATVVAVLAAGGVSSAAMPAAAGTARVPSGHAGARAAAVRAVAVRRAGLAGAVPSGAVISAVDALSATSAWAVGSYCVSACATAPVIHTLIAAWNGTAWSQIPSPSPGGSQGHASLSAVAATSATDAWAVGSWANRRLTRGGTLILHWDGTTWSQVPSPSPGGCASSTAGCPFLAGVSADSPSDAWAVGGQDISGGTETSTKTLILQWDGTTWTAVSAPSPRSGAIDLNGVTAVSASDAWAVGDYCPQTACVGYPPFDPLILHWDGTAWSRVPSPSAGGKEPYDILSGVAATSPADVWAVGRWNGRLSGKGGTLILHWDGTAWSQVPSPSPGADPGDDTFSGVAAVSPTQAWATGSWGNTKGTRGGTLIAAWDGTAWTQVASPAPGPLPGYDDLVSVSADAPADAWAVGDYCASACARSPNYQPLLLHWNGATWSGS